MKGPVSLSLSCPNCSAPLPGPEPAPACPACQLPLTGPVAVELWQTDQQLAALQQRRSSLLTTLRAGIPTDGRPLPDRDPAQQPTGNPPAGPVSGTPVPLFPRESTPATSSRPPRPEHPSWTGQQLLLGAGALLVVTAAVVFLAVAWSVIGVAGQVAVMGLATAACAAASFGTARRGLRATAETLAVLTVALAVVDAAAAHALNLADLRAVGTDGYAAAVSAGLAVGCAGAASYGRSLLSYRLAAVAAAAVSPLLTLSYLEPAPAPTAFVLLVVAAAFGALGRFLPDSWQVVEGLVTVAGGGYLLLAWGAGLAGLTVDPLVGSGGVAGMVALAGAVGAAWVSRLHHGFDSANRHPVLAGGALLVGAGTVVLALWRVDESGLLVLCTAVAAAAVSGYLSVRPRPLLTHPVGVALAFAQLVLVLAVLTGQFGVLDKVSDHTPVWAALVAAYAVTTVSSTWTAVTRPLLRTIAAGYAAAAFQLAVVAAAYPSGPTASVAAASAAAVLLAATAAWRRDRPEERLLAVGWLLAVPTALAYSVTAPQGSAQLAASALAVAGLTAFGYGLIPGRGNTAIAGALLCSAAIWTLLGDREVTTVEAYSLPLAALIAVVGLGRLYRDRTAPSWLTVGPALTAALLPSALLSIGEEGLTRPLLVLVAGALVLVIGVLARWQAPVATGTLALVIVSASQLAPYAVGLPRWLTFGTVGLALLLLGARYEQRRRNAQQAARWVAALR